MYLYKDISYLHNYEYDWIWKGSSTPQNHHFPRNQRLASCIRIYLCVLHIFPDAGKAAKAADEAGDQQGAAGSEKDREDHLRIARVPMDLSLEGGSYDVADQPETMHYV